MKLTNSALESDVSDLTSSVSNLTEQLETAKSQEAKHQVEVEDQERQSVVEEEPEKQYNSQDSPELGALRSDNERLKQRVFYNFSGEL
eukprot:TRINITY_DN6298_c0_g1_i1.p1 TRINITY_DN6298_c0_g1~~TRINITY_DN6298_c0_g1_i1.p1  ORF type:complete len:88 (-),score=15.62 TRINITY_DN6298_c0_g1_i1:330-593(-)